MRTTADIAADLESGLTLYDDALADAWRDLLMQFRFAWFVTFTFKEPVHPEAADKRFRLWMKYLNEYVGGRKAAQEGNQPLYWIRALEWQKREVLHYHALIGHALPLSERIQWNRDKSSKTSLMYWEELWFRLAGICRIEQIRSDEAVSAYCSKYIAKGGQIDVCPAIDRSIPNQLGLLAGNR